MALSPIVFIMIVLVLLLLMFGLGATMKDSDIVAVSRRPKGVFVGLGSQFLWMPLIAYLMCVAFGWSDGSDTDKLYASTLILQVNHEG
jgi:predicted Na+-dependent transporter